jgi:hypothetical protein
MLLSLFGLFGLQIESEFHSPSSQRDEGDDHTGYHGGRDIDPFIPKLLEKGRQVREHHHAPM